MKKKLDERREAMKKKELEEHMRSKRTSLEVRLEEQANKLKTVSIQPILGPILVLFDVITS